MKLWTIRSQDVWTMLPSKGVCRPREPFLPIRRLNASRGLSRKKQNRQRQSALAGRLPVWVCQYGAGTRKSSRDHAFRPARRRGCWRLAANEKTAGDECRRNLPNGVLDLSVLAVHQKTAGMATQIAARDCE